MRAQSPAAAKPRPAGNVAVPENAASHSSSQGGDATPPAMVAFFMTETCPTGWVIPASAQGRLIIGVNDASAVGLMVNTAMGDMTPPTHQHGYSTTVNLNRKNIALANGSNKQGAKKGNYTVGGTTEPSPSGPNDAQGLPFIQLTICQKQ
jgi:hypothetical protein